eukprot:CAMPEP_0173070030 /NCGR_PEP_ID=MMETSP1102-20130122/8372_1 /TAXON_ID=49646 /ORGANISM="Geminigera sp., Strain Caron Lab Isolate" /LENGTH=713 /DNA_ID=CAMNT_0013938217 /DNA_START=39 /DNA_END=2181 /DNA_ORIENTATION=+
MPKLPDDSDSRDTAREARKDGGTPQGSRNDAENAANDPAGFHVSGFHIKGDEIETNDDLVPTVPHLELSSRGGGGDDGADKDAHDEDAGKDAKSEDVVISVDSAAAAGINADGNVKVLETPADTQSSRAPSALVRSDSGEYLDRPFEFVRPRSSSRNPPPTGEEPRSMLSNLARASLDIARKSIQLGETVARTGTVMCAPSEGVGNLGSVPKWNVVDGTFLDTADEKSTDNPLVFTRKFAGGLIADIKRRAPWYLSDWTEAFKEENRSQVVASIIFLFFACLSPAVTFGMLFNEYTEGQLGVVEMILSSGISGVVYALFSGQPLCILGATVYGAIAVFDMCALMKYVTRFTEEIFAALISVIFIFEAILNVAKLYVEDTSTLGRARAFAGTLLCLGSFAMATMLKNLKAGVLLNPTVRSLLANYGVIFSIIVFTFLNWVFRDVGNATLQVPSTIAPTYVNPVTNQTRPWIVNPMGTNKPFPAWGIAFTALPALGLAFLGYMDQNLTSLLINRKDHVLRKPPAYHLDLFVCGLLVYPLLSFLGLPFTHAATVRSMTHLISLSTREIVKLEGGGTTTKVTSVIESRVTHMGIHILLLLSLLFTPLLRMIPRTVLYGVFLFMGIGSMAGNELFDRLHLLAIWVPKAYPKYEYTKHVSFWSLHSFTLFQFSMLVVLFVLTRVKAISVAFPFFIGLLVPIRWGMIRIWSKEDLKWLDS